MWRFSSRASLGCPMAYIRVRPNVPRRGRVPVRSVPLTALSASQLSALLVSLRLGLHRLLSEPSLERKHQLDLRIIRRASSRQIAMSSRSQHLRGLSRAGSR